MDKESDLISYYKQEFEMLKDAHFQTSQKIISFFQFALLIFSAPIALLTSNQISRIVLGGVFVLIGIIEVLIIAYLSSLRVEALLYARQINRIRSILYSNGVIGTKTDEIHKRKILFSQDKKPDYKDSSQFIYIVFVLGLFSAFYFSFGFYKIATYFDLLKTKGAIFSTVFVCGFFVVAVAYVMYKIVITKGENGTEYYKQRIGVDIDGVLNNHENVFVEILKETTGKSLKCSDIKSLPVSISTDVTRDEEHNIFETKEYWESQKLAAGAKQYLIEEIRNTIGYKPYIFTWRNWNVDKDLKGEQVKFDIEKHTKKWLKDNGIVFEKIIFESGNYDAPISLFSSKYKTRYYYAKKYKIRYFVEDNLRNAEKLSHICEYVFLVDHPYNQTENALPYNVIRVSNWQEISEWIKNMN